MSAPAETIHHMPNDRADTAEGVSPLSSNRKKISRREFLRGAVLAAEGFALAACTPTETPQALTPVPPGAEFTPTLGEQTETINTTTTIPSPTAPDQKPSQIATSVMEVGPQRTPPAPDIQSLSDTTVAEWKALLGSGGPLPEGFMENKDIKDYLTKRSAWLAASGYNTTDVNASNYAMIKVVAWGSGDSFRWDVIPVDKNDGLVAWLQLQDSLIATGWRYMESPSWDSRLTTSSTIRYAHLPQTLLPDSHYEIVLRGETKYFVEVDTNGNPLRVFDPIRQEMAVLKGAIVATKTPEPTPTPELTFINEAFYNIAEWKNYPEVKLDDITSGKIADTLRNSGTLKPFDKSKLIPWEKLFMFNNGLYSLFYYVYNQPETLAAKKDYDARPMRTVGGLTVVLPDGSKAVGWVEQISTDSPEAKDGYALAILLRASPSTFPPGLQERADYWLTEITRNMQEEGGGYICPFYLMNPDEIEKYSATRIAIAVNEGWIPDFLQRIGYDPKYEGYTNGWKKGHANPAGIEHIVWVGNPEQY